MSPLVNEVRLNHWMVPLTYDNVKRKALTVRKKTPDMTEAVLQDQILKLKNLKHIQIIRILLYIQSDTSFKRISWPPQSIWAENVFPEDFYFEDPTATSNITGHFWWIWGTIIADGAAYTSACKGKLTWVPLSFIPARVSSLHQHFRFVWLPVITSSFFLFYFKPRTIRHNSSDSETLFFIKTNKNYAKNVRKVFLLNFNLYFRVRLMLKLAFDSEHRS